MENWNYTNRVITAAIDGFLKHRKIARGPLGPVNFEVIDAFAPKSRDVPFDSPYRFLLVLLERFSERDESWGDQMVPSIPIARDFVYVLEPYPSVDDRRPIDDWLHPILEAVGVALARMGIETGIRMVES